MKVKRSCVTAVLMLFAAVLFTSCEPNFNVEPQKITLAVGESYRLSGTVQQGSMTFINADMDSWESSNPEVATVDEYGVVTAVSPGQSTITAYYKKQTGSCLVTVKEGLK
jgi:uncharacterized protein YjdB